MECEKCHAPRNPGARFCSACGHPVPPDASIELPLTSIVCSACGARQMPGEAYCSECGQALHRASPQPAPPSLPAATSDVEEGAAAKPGRRLRPVAIIAGMAIAVALGFAGQRFYLEQRDERFLDSARNSDVIAVKKYLAQGINPNTRPDPESMTALMQAATFGNTSVVKALIAGGADVNAQMGAGWTALKWAAFSGKAETVQALIDAGADVNAVGYKGHSTLNSARSQGHTEIVRMLQQAGAKE